MSCCPFTAYAVFLTSQGVIQNFDAYKDVTTMEATKYDAPKNGPDGQPMKDEKGAVLTEPAETQTQTLPMGPVASQEAIKMLGTVAGASSMPTRRTPFENPDAALQLRPDAVDFPDSGRTVFYLGVWSAIPAVAGRCLPQ